jgi:hypothetical protein
VDVSVLSSEEIEWASLCFQSGRTVPLAVHGVEASGSYAVERDDQYWVAMQDRFGISNDHPIRYNIRVLQDMYPIVKILSPETPSDLDQTLSVPLVLEEEDDYGIGASRIGYSISSPSQEQKSAADTVFLAMTLPSKNPAHVLFSHLWKLAPLSLFPEDIVNYFIEVEDNDRLNGPKRGRSGMQSVRFPSIMEIVEKIESEQNRQMEQLDAIHQEYGEFNKDLTQLSDELKTGQPVPWERKKDIQNKIANQQKNQEDIQNFTDRFDAVLDEIRKNDWIMQETLIKKYEELQLLVQELASPEMREALERFQEAMNQIDPLMLKNAAENLRITQEDMIKALDRTLSIFRRLQAEQKVDELIGRLKEMGERQRDINQRLSDNFEANRSQSSLQEQKLQRESEAVQEDAEKLTENTGDLPGFPADSYQTFLNALKREKLSDQFRSISTRIQNGNTDEAFQQGETAVQSTEQLQKMLEGIRQQMQNQQKNRVFAALKRTSRQLLQLSQQQETLQQEVQETKRTNARAAEMQGALMKELQQATDLLYRLSQETFSVPPGLGKAIGEAKQNMQQTLDQLESDNIRAALLSQTRSMAALNRSVVETQNTMEKLSGSKSGLDMEGLFGEMEQIGLDQMALNQKLMEMLQQGRLSMESQAGMPRLAAEQQSIRQRLERLLQDYEAMSKIPGDLSGLLEEINKVIQELNQKKANAETVKRQERILSRMLDSQRSLQEQDYGPKRKAIAGREVVRGSPAQIMEKTSISAARLRERLLGLADEGYAPEFQEWIQQYYKRLAKEDQ